MRSSNPFLKESSFQSSPAVAGQTMTVSGAVNKTLILLAILSGSFFWTWNITTSGQNPMPWIIGGAIAGLVLALVTVFAKQLSPITAPLYALAEGLLLGGISALYEAQFGGIVLQAIFLTFGVLFGMLAMYRLGWIRATERFRTGVMAATMAVALVYLASIVLRFFGIQIPFIHESGLIGIGFSVVVIVIAALNLILDFDLIEMGAAYNAPRHMEWYSAFGLLVTLVWLYLEILRLLSKLRRE